jgi:hypothetical protein
MLTLIKRENKTIKLGPNFGNSLVRQKSVAKIEFCPNPTMRENNFYFIEQKL